MIAKRDAAIVRDFAGLVARHGAEQVLRVANMMRDPKQAGEIAEILERAATAGDVGTSGRARVRDASRVGLGLLKELRKADPEKHAAIADIRLQLLSGGALPTMGDLRSFSFSHGLDIGKASSRSAAIAPLLKSLSRLPVEAIRKITTDLTEYEANDSSLASWWDVIVKTPITTTGR